MKKRLAIITPGGIGAGHFSQGYPPLLNFVEKMTADFDVFVYSIHPINPDFNPSGYKLKSVHPFIRISKLRSLFLFLRVIIDHIRFRFSIIHGFWIYPAGTLAVIIGMLIKVPSVVTIQGGEAAGIAEIGYGNMLKPWLRKITLWTCEKATHLNSISLFLIDEMKEHSLMRQDYSVIPFGAELSLFKNATREREKVFNLIHVANLTEVKDQFTLLRAFAHIVNEIPARLRIVGDDAMGGRLQEFAKQLNLNGQLEFVGVVPNKELPQHYAWAHVMIHTSLHEGQSGVVMEAMASGVVVCSTRVGMVYDLGDKYFETAAIGDDKEIASKVINLWKDRERYDILRTNALEYVASHNANWTAGEYKKLYLQIISHG